MKQRRTAVFVVLMALVVMLLGGCASTLQSRKIDKENLQTTVLVDPSVLEKGKEGEALYRYINPKVDWKNYTKIIIDPVVVYQEAALDAETRENYQKLANNAYAYLTNDLEKDHTIVTTPGPDTLRLQLAIVSAEKSLPVRNFLTTIVPIGMAVSAVKYGATGTPMAVGEITGEMRATDSMTGELLAAALDKRVGGKQLQERFPVGAGAGCGFRPEVLGGIDPLQTMHITSWRGLREAETVIGGANCRWAAGGRHMSPRTGQMLKQNTGPHPPNPGAALFKIIR